MRRFLVSLQYLWNTLIQFNQNWIKSYPLTHRCISVTLFTFIFVGAASCIVFNTQILSPVAHALESFNVADNYFKTNWSMREANGQQPTISENITIVNLGGATREKTAETLQLLDSMEPSAIGIDVIFHKDSVANTDTRHLLDSTIFHMPHLVLAAKLEGGYEPYDSIIPIDAASPNSLLGYVNTEVAHGNVMNKISIQRRVADTTMTSMPALLVEQYRDMKFSQRGDTEDRPIEFPYIDFTVLQADTLSERSWSAVHNRIVLVGYMDDPLDFKITPIDDNMPGVKVWAYGINTLLGYTEQQNHPTSEINTLMQWVINILVTIVAILWLHGWYRLTERHQFVLARYFRCSGLICTIVMLILAAFTAMVFFLVFHEARIFIHPAFALASIAIVAECYDLYDSFFEKTEDK